MYVHNNKPDGSWTHRDVFKEKECVVCGTKFKPKSGIHKFCSEKCKGKWKYITGRMSTENQYKIISGNWKKYLARLASRSNKRKVTVQDLLDILEKQNYRCALSGEKLTCTLEKGKICHTNASLDRIEAGGEYTKDNIQIVCSILNKFRLNTKLEEFIDWCGKVHKYNEKKE